ncbi:MAG: DNA topoisomerase 4 subunit A [Acidimicrobiia bacterium]|nr:DNA topoisomerase 4 subunit A [Acidimicrobiia bacterium]
MGQSFLPYSLSVITSRALPDVRDGLKPVQRRILLSMSRLGLRPGNPHRKCATVVGDVIGKYHPHGDGSVYEALVRLGQPFSMRVPLVDPHGNFGSPDDPPAAYRYTECRLHEAAVDLLGELDEDTVEFRPTFDGELDEPEYLPARLPNLLVNGSSGIAVGMATNIPPHNLGEVCRALELVLRRPDDPPSTDELLQVLPGPDFPTGGIVVDDGTLREAYTSGRGGLRLRAKAEVAQVTARRRGIIVTELPFSVGPERVLARIKELVLGGKLDAITDVKNLTDRKSGLRLQIECRPGSDPHAVLTALYRLTPMEETFGVNNVVLVRGVPTTLGLYDLCRLYLEHRLDVVVRRTRHRLGKDRDRAHLLEGLLVALDNLDRVIALIRRSKDVDTARRGLRREFGLSDAQANAILDMQLRRLTRLERTRLTDELDELRRRIADYEATLASEARRRDLVAEELAELAGRLDSPRRTRIVGADAAPKLSAASLPTSFELADEACTVTLSTSGWVGRELAAAPPTRGRLGRHDLLADAVHTSNRSTVLALTDRARALSITVAEVPEVAGRTRGAAVSELFGVERGERVVALLGAGEEPLVLVTAGGLAKRLAPDELAGLRDGSSLLTLSDADRLVAAFRAPEEADVVLVASDGSALRTTAASISAQGRAARGVAGMRLRKGAGVLAAGPATETGVVLGVGGAGDVKLTAHAELSAQGRGGSGVRLARARSGEAGLRLAVVASSAELWCLLAREDDPAREDPQPKPVPVLATPRGAPPTRSSRALLAAGTARW